MDTLPFSPFLAIVQQILTHPFSLTFALGVSGLLLLGGHRIFILLNRAKSNGEEVLNSEPEEIDEDASPRSVGGLGEGPVKPKRFQNLNRSFTLATSYFAAQASRRGSLATPGGNGGSRSRSGSSSSLPLKPSHHGPSGGFLNPWPSAAPPSFSTLFSGFPLQFAVPLPEEEEDGEEGDDEDEGFKVLGGVERRRKRRRIGVVKPDWKVCEERRDALIGTWLGHASFLVQLPQSDPKKRPVRVMFDPVFSDRTSPVAYVGPVRTLPPPCKVEELPEVDFVCISHNHYDHLDLATITALNQCQPGVRYLVPLGLKEWFKSAGISPRQVSELDWWEESDLGPTVARDDPDIPAASVDSFKDRLKLERRVKFTCTPAQHSSGRGVTDQGATLWCGWIVEQYPGEGSEGRSSVFFAGDTGYRSANAHEPVCPIFKEIGEKFYPIDLALIPIWRGGSLSFVSAAGLQFTKDHFTRAHHTSPHDAVCVHLDLRARHSVAIHHATFVGSLIESAEAMELLSTAKEAKGVGDLMEEGGFGVTDIGEMIVLRTGSQAQEVNSV
ncbi:hypothetical protein JAAARDRAFT_30867 [Jaapia argillacea MUCL 33604]|uniref:Metallo-beta-lactamase domain-containing protein n=1 Tax=Jaapia argillacea MUCL 33604 TaxID=933084 RepID=A0A067QFS7_9AGAM|nr:hypothetical protein JAAARDRAFT_30867 [Jaapia argillacea MUCL 33604]